jgi:hypothetical protein
MAAALAPFPPEKYGTAAAKLSPDAGEALDKPTIALDALVLCPAIEALGDCASSCTLTRTANMQSEENTRRRDGVRVILGFISEALSLAEI